MKIMFISDIHGIKTNLPKIKEKFEKFNCDKLVVLGDLYYIGPRNKMIEGYDIKYVQEFLSSFKDKLICVRGNCDSEVDLMVSDFPIVNELSLISTINEDLYLTHGHIYNESNWLKTNSTLIICAEISILSKSKRSGFGFEEAATKISLSILATAGRRSSLFLGAISTIAAVLFLSSSSSNVTLSPISGFFASLRNIPLALHW